MIEYALIALLTAVVLFEVIEHVVLPLVGFLLSRNRKPIIGAEGMVGEVAEVRFWRKNDGQVFVNGELWQAICAAPLVKGDKVVILAVDGLTLRVEQFDEATSGIEHARSPQRTRRKCR